MPVDDLVPAQRVDTDGSEPVYVTPERLREDDRYEPFGEDVSDEPEASDENDSEDGEDASQEDEEREDDEGVEQEDDEAENASQPPAFDDYGDLDELED